MIQRAPTAAVAALLLASGLAGATSGGLSVTALRGEAAKVNGAVITRAELDAAVKRLGPPAGAPTDAQRRQVRAEMLALLIEKELMRQFLDRDPSIPKVEPAEIERRVKEMAQRLKKADRSIEEFCHETHQTPEQFKAAVADHIRWSSYVARRATPERLEAFYKENKEVFDGATVRASHIVLRLPAGSPGAEVEKAQATLERVREKIVRDRADFAEMARQYSQGPEAKNGGELGAPFHRKWDYDEPFARAAFALKAGEVSEVVRTDYGLHLIKVTARSPGKPTDFASARPAVLELFAEELRQEVLAEERKKADIKVFLD
jgi:parvulin-like peptidyl-prolyl isomerase